MFEGEFRCDGHLPVKPIEAVCVCETPSTGLRHPEGAGKRCSECECECV